MYILYTDPDVSDSHFVFKTLEAAEAQRTRIAESRSEGMCKERFCVAYDYMDIEKLEGGIR